MDSDQVRQALKRVIDPELGVNIVDLGLVYDVHIDGGRVRVDMTMTSPSCPLSSFLTEAVQEDVTFRVPGVASVDVNIVWQPPWSPSMMSREARAQLGLPDEPAAGGADPTGDR
jgi:metal-sulfur cluster biosynthetic enzyme